MLTGFFTTASSFIRPWQLGQARSAEPGLYSDALSRDLVPTGLRNYAVEFKGAHEGHRDTQVEILRERGLDAVAPHRVDPIRDTPAGDAVIRRLLSVEAAAESAYLRLIGQIRTSDYLLAAGFIVGTISGFR